MESEKLQRSIEAIDRFNRGDPRQVVVDGVVSPYELIYSKKLTDWVLKLNPNASEALRIAARGQHIGRWTIPRDTTPMDREGYLRWREALKAFHAQKVGEILKEVSCEEDFIQRVQSIILKKNLKKDAETQTLEDALCLVFLETQFEDLKKKEPPDKMKEILLKTWRKMSPKGQDLSFQVKLSYELQRFLEETLATEMYGVELAQLLKSTRSLRDAVVAHPLYQSIETIEQVRTFMEHHVFAVWDFMSLVKSLQMTLTCTSVPWIPRGDPMSRRLINEIVLDEESDENGEGGITSHFELYLEAMKQCGADTSRIEAFVLRLGKGETVPDALRTCQCPDSVILFVEKTWRLVESRSPHNVAAALTIGREEVIPEMFQRVIRNIQERIPEERTCFVHYLDRHIDVDKGRHAPMAMRMLKKLCGEDPIKWQEATETAQRALQARVQLWDAITKKIAGQDRDPLTHESIRQYYGKVLKTRRDLKTSACCATESYPPHVREWICEIPQEVLDKSYGCGTPIPPLLEGTTVLDLGCGAGRDLFILSRLVGPSGHLIGIDMTPEQLAVARRHLSTKNVTLLEGTMEDLEGLGIQNASLDLIISNCVINLSPDKRRVFSEIFRVLRPGGELYFSDVFASRRIPKDLATDPILLGECLGGALYIEDFRRILLEVGCKDYRVVTNTKLKIQDPEVSAKIGTIDFYSTTIRAFKLKLEDRCEDYGQVAVYLGTIPESPHTFDLDDHHLFEKGGPVPVCSNTAAMLQETRYAPHFRVTGDLSTHYGLFDCGTSPHPLLLSQEGEKGEGGGCCD